MTLSSSAQYNSFLILISKEYTIALKAVNGLQKKYVNKEAWGERAWGMGQLTPDIK